MKSIVIGLGEVGMGYDYNQSKNNFINTHSQSISLNKSFILSAGVDLIKKRRSNFEKKFNKPAYKSISQAIKKIKPKLVVIAVPTKKHFEVFNKVAKDKNVRFIICEKPMSNSLFTAEKMLQSAFKKKKILIVNYFRNFEPGCIKMLKYVKNGNLGKHTIINIDYFKGIFNNGSHFINLLNQFLGKPKKIEILKNNSFWKKWDPEPDFKVFYDNGVAKFNLVKNKKNKFCKMIIKGDKGTLSYLNNGKKIVITKKNKKVFTIPNQINLNQKFVLQNLENYVFKKSKILCDGNSALDTMKVLNQINKKI